MEACTTLKFIPNIALLLLVEEQARYYCLNRNSKLSFKFVMSILNEYSVLEMNTNLSYLIMTLLSYRLFLRRLMSYMQCANKLEISWKLSANFYDLTLTLKEAEEEKVLKRLRGWGGWVLGNRNEY